MTAKEKEEIKSRLEDADKLEYKIGIVTECLTALNNPTMEQELGTNFMANSVWVAIKKMPKEYRDAIAVCVKKWGEQLNEEYKKL